MTETDIYVPQVLLTIQSCGGQVLARPSGAIVLAIPSGTLILKNLLALPDLLPALPTITDFRVADKLPDLGTAVEPYTDLADRSVCTMQPPGLRVRRRCNCENPCIRLKPLLRVVLPSPISAQLELHAARATGPGGVVIFRATR